MSSHLNILLDTNIIISLNDLEYPLDPRLAEMQRLLDQLSFHVFVHPAQKDDLNRDTNADRRRRNLSRLDQYNVLNSPPEPSPEDISALGWVENRDNDRVDNLLLYALKSGAVHILVSENCTGIVIQRFNRSPCKTEKCGIGQGFPHVTGIPDFIGIAFAVKSCL